MTAIVKKITSNWSNSGIINEEDIDIYVYGLEILLYSLFNIIAILITAAIYGYMLESIILVIVIIPLQAYGGGYHANTHLRCFLIMYIGWWLVVHLLQFINTPISVILCLLSVIVIFSLAPISNQNVPMSEKHRKKLRTIIRIITLIITCLSIIFSSMFKISSHIGITIAVGLGITTLSMLLAYIKDKYMQYKIMKGV
ncbi:MAG: accessory gene regulator B family protein [Oscillospiraceae bacterium]|jgi:accessory gene regulator B|nr:accessory gene regulator B family protein [Oscillospiraceae bacterium]